MFWRPLLLVACLAIAPAAAAEPRGGHMIPVQAVIQPQYMVPAQDRGERQRIMPLREIVGMVQSRFGGRLLGADLEQNGDRPFYILRWELPNGDRRDFRVDAVSGQIR